MESVDFIMREVLGKYILLDRIAVGGMAEVFRAKLTGEKGFEKLIVVKKMLPQLAEDPEMVTHFIDEAKLAALLQHENIIHVYDFGETEGSYFIAMEYLFGKDLKSVFTKTSQINAPLGLENSLLIAAKICEGLEYAHNLKDLHGASLNIIHRDISPQNIFITYDGKVKIIDFGIAKTTTQTTKTQVGIIKGKVAYMSPEQAEGKSIDKRSDIFAAGIILYEMITGQEMYSGDTMEVLNKAIHAQYEPLEDIAPDMPSQVYDILHRALHKNIDERYQSCGEMMADIENCLYEMGCRPTTKILEQYIARLFDKEYLKEKDKSIEILKDTADEEMAEHATSPANQNYQKTRVINRKVGAKDVIKPAINYAKQFKEKTSIKALQRFSKKIVSGKKKWAALISVLILLTIFGTILIKSIQAKKAKPPEPALSMDFFKKIPKIIIDDIKEDMDRRKKSSPQEREPGR